MKTKNIQRTHKKQEEHEERRISNKLIRFITISFQRYFNPFSNQSEDILCLNQTTSTQLLNWWFPKEIELDDHSIKWEYRYRELYLQIHQYKNTFVKLFWWFDFQTWDFVFTIGTYMVSGKMIMDPMSTKMNL